MNDMTLNFVTIKPLMKPIKALRRTPTIIATINGVPLIARIADNTPLKDAMVPIERSNSSTFIIKVVPRDITAKIAIWRVTFQKFTEEKKAPGFMEPKMRIMRRRDIIVPYDCMIDFKLGRVILIVFFIGLPFFIAKMQYLFRRKMYIG